METVGFLAMPGLVMTLQICPFASGDRTTALAALVSATTSLVIEMPGFVIAVMACTVAAGDTTGQLDA